MVSNLFGFLSINKPIGLTSRDVVNELQRMVPGVKLGHAGTLDPLATGVLVVAVGPATRLIDYVQRMPKRYVGTFLLGRTSDTEDTEGIVVELANPPQPTRDAIEAALLRFLGTIQQRPPAFSALKIQGRRSYELARRGQPAELQPRPVVVHSLRLLRYEYPEMELEICCGSGTYVRSLGRDLAEALGTGAVMSGLVRAAIGSFRMEDARSLSELTPDAIPSRLLPPVQAVAELPSVELRDEEIKRIANGMAIENRWHVEGLEIAAVNAAGQLAAILRPRDTAGLGPLLNFPQRPG
jgi:tRNA pseudouridine55 synthase